MSPSVILGVSSDYHDSAACVLVDGEIVAACLEERLTRRKHDASLPRNAIAWCLDEAGVAPGELECVALHDKPLSTYERILATHALGGPQGVRALTSAVSQWSGRKLWIGYRVERFLQSIGHLRPALRWAEHHQSHAAAAFFPSPFEEAAVLTVDGVGEWSTATIGHGSGNRLTIHEELRFPDSVGLFYSAMTAHCGFRVNDGEFKLMGLAPFGRPTYVTALREHVVHCDSDGRFRLDPRYFSWISTESMTRPALGRLLDLPQRSADDPLTQEHADLAASTQVVLEEAILAFARRAHRATGAGSLAMAGGVALNCVANARLLEHGPFDSVWVQPAAGDDGSAVGAALWVWHQVEGRPRDPAGTDSMRGALLGPAFRQAEVAAWMSDEGIPHAVVPEDDELHDTVAAGLEAGEVVGWCSGAMEFGPRALGNRSILADPRDPAVVSRLNELTKGREGFRPFAPAVTVEAASTWFDTDTPMPYMLFTAQVRGFEPPDPGSADLDPARSTFSERLAHTRSPVPACTHVDGSARVQTVDREVNPSFHGLLSAFGRRTGCPVLLNTSFNRADEPIVCTPQDAFRTFVAAGLDTLVVEGVVVRRKELPS